MTGMPTYGPPMPLVLPVGHYLGPVHPARDTPPSHHAVRIGWEQARLANQDQLDVWLLAHGVPAQLDQQPWTRESLLRTADETGVGNPDAALADLLGRRLVIEVALDEDSALTLARTYRLLPLLVGLGTGPGEPLDVIGIPGLLMALRAEPRVFELWQWAHLWPDLWSACAAVAEASADSADAGLSADRLDDDGLVSFGFGAAQTLIAHGAAYLDARRAPAPTGRTDER